MYIFSDDIEYFNENLDKTGLNTPTTDKVKGLFLKSGKDFKPVPLYLFSLDDSLIREHVQYYLVF